MKSFTPPQQIPVVKHTVFLAGTIDMGKSDDWQSLLEEYFEDTPWTVFNPRRSDWNDFIDNDIKDPYFYQQVNWELNALEKADKVLFNFLPYSASPISLMELGLFKDKAIVCSSGEYRKDGNIQIVCDRYRVPYYNDINDLLKIHFPK